MSGWAGRYLGHPAGKRLHRGPDQQPLGPTVAGVHQEDTVAHDLVVLADPTEDQLASWSDDPLDDDRLDDDRLDDDRLDDDRLDDDRLVGQRRTSRTVTRVSTTRSAATVPAKI